MRQPSYARGSDPPPRLLQAVSLLVLCTCVVLSVHGAVETGVTTDEPIHVMRLRNFFDTGWYALDWDYVGGGPGTEGTNTFVYGPATMLLLHAWSVAWSVEEWGEVATTSLAYDVRHLGVVLIGLVCIAAVAAIGRVLMTQWRWGLVSAAALAAIPTWTGHQMFNVKDVPVATGYTLLTMGLLGFVRHDLPHPPLRLARAGAVAVGLVLCLGTRPGMWSALAVSLAVSVAGILRGSEGRRNTGVSLAELGVACVAAASALVATYPYVFGSPHRALSRTTESSSSFLDGEASDRLYVPRHVAEEIPTLLLFFVLVGAVLGAVVAWRAARSEPVEATRVALVGLQAFTLPVLAIALGSDLYHGLRQLLFAAPAAAVLAAYGMRWSLERPARPRWTATAATAALLLPLVDQVTLHPYQTSYVNVATDLVTRPFVAAGDRPGGDFWRASLPELIAGKELERQLLCKAVLNEEGTWSFRFADGGVFSTSRSLDCREEAYGPLAAEAISAARIVPTAEYDAVFLKTLPENCSPLDQVTRWRHGFEVVLTILARCRVDPPTLTRGGVQAASPALGTGTSDDLWRFAVDGWERWPSRQVLHSPVREAVLAFRAPVTCREVGCTLLLEGTVPRDLVVHLSGSAVRTSQDQGVLRVPVGARAARDPEGVWLTLRRRSGQPLDLHLARLAIDGSSPAPPKDGRR